MRKKTILALVILVMLTGKLYAALPPVSPEIQKKLDDILKGQQSILAQLDDIKKELEIVKIRATH